MITQSQRRVVQEHNRYPTDKCWIYSAAIYWVVILISCTVKFQPNEIIKLWSFKDSDGNICGSEALKQFQYLLLRQKQNHEFRICVSGCLNNQKKTCYKNSKSSCHDITQIYKKSQELFEKICLPLNYNFNLGTNGLLQHRELLKALKTFAISLSTAIIVSFVFILCMQLALEYMIYVVIMVGGTSVVGLSLVFFVKVSDQLSVKLTNIVSLSLMLFGLSLLYSLFSIRNQFKVLTVFMTKAIDSIGQVYFIFTYVLLYPIFLLLHLAFCAMQLTMVATSNIQLGSLDKAYFEIKQFDQLSLALAFSIMIQFIWGISILKQSFSYLICAISVNCYFQVEFSLIDPIRILLKYSFGSVLESSWLTLFLSTPEFILYQMEPEQSENTHLYARCFHYSLGWLQELCYLARIQCLAYSYLHGVNYSNSAKQCSKLYRLSTSPSYKQGIVVLRYSTYGLFMAMAGFVGAHFLTLNAYVQILLLLMLITIFVVSFVNMQYDFMTAMLVCYQNQQHQQYLKESKKHAQLQNGLLN